MPSVQRRDYWPTPMARPHQQLSSPQAGQANSQKEAATAVSTGLKPTRSFLLHPPPPCLLFIFFSDTLDCALKFLEEYIAQKTSWKQDGTLFLSEASRRNGIYSNFFFSFLLLHSLTSLRPPSKLVPLNLLYFFVCLDTTRLLNLREEMVQDLDRTPVTDRQSENVLDYKQEK